MNAVDAEPKTDADYEVEVDRLLEEIRLMQEEMHEQMREDQPEIDAVKAETKANLANAMQILDAMEQRRNEETE